MIAPVRVLEYGRDASVFDPMFLLFAVFVSGTAVLVTLALAAREFARKHYLASLSAIAVIPISFVVFRCLENHLSGALNVYYK